MAEETPPPFKPGQIYVPQLESTFKISESELYDYYSTNSGMYPKNPGSSGGGGGGGGGGDDPSEEIQALQNRVGTLEGKTNKLANNARAAANQAANVEDNLNNYQNADDILNSVVTLKKSVQTLNN